ncbi:hypothetical protein PHYBOEH_011277 [Phytophthora boehmeriae]|uniref:Peptidase M14 domain-containing protein n=1 Tax=Phytophthora boehmeriae TaxID=109152 RepID=A0A8T1X375_9STRA|nr:hypothetical protein PHYBOEH_011277 [Phytophthora boehmeriae]
MVEIHRSRVCELSRLWTLESSTADSLTALQQQQQQQKVVWEAVDTCDSASSCYRESAVSVINGTIELQADVAEGSMLRISRTLQGNRTTLHRLALRMQLPQNGGHVEARASVHMPRRGLTMVVGSPPADAASNEVFIGSSQNSSIVAELPCITDVADAFHDVEFVWDDKWLRGYVDNILLLEETVQDSGKTHEESDSDLIVELSVKATGSDGRAAKLAVKRISLSSGSSSDPLCGPQYSTSSNCRTKTAFAPRLGSTQGSLSTTEVDAYIDEVAARFPLITRVDDFGKSVEGRPLRALCLGACYTENIPQALFTGMHHAREPISMMNLVYTIDILTTDYVNGDLAALELLSSRQLWFMLLVNPDGYAHNEMQRVWEHNKMGQRKSAQPNCDKSPADAGVDLNRNYDACFARDSKGSSNDPCGDDYNGPSPFSEPETQAVRELVERNTSDFSVALNYHSYGKYFNLPFACEAEGQPAEPSNSTFRALAREMARFNGFRYGQSWKESNLYTVNGETSDWMWQAHGIFAMSPEVGPAFDVDVGIGFWPHRDDVPQLSADLHYSNLYISRMAGPVYSLDVKNVELGPTNDPASAYVSVQVVISNRGLRPASAELIGSIFQNGTSSSDPIHLELAGELEASGSNPTDVFSVVHTVNVPSLGYTEGVQAVYFVIRDSSSCHLFRISVSITAENPTKPTFQTWAPLPLPRCGTCELFGTKSILSGSSKPADVMPMCPEIKDVTLVESVRSRSIDPVLAIGSTTGSDISSSANYATSKPTAGVTVSNTTANVNITSASGSAEATGNQGSSMSSSILSASVSWTGPVAMASIAGIVLLVVAVFLFCRRCRSKKSPGRVKTGTGTQKKQRNVQYSRINENVNESPVGRDDINFDDDADEDEEVDAEFGKRRIQDDESDDVVLKNRALSPPRRDVKPPEDIA